MRVRVLYFGALKDIFLKDRETLDLPSAATVGTLLDHCREAAPGQGNFWDILAVAVNTEYAAHSQLLADGDEVALLPPVSGGSGDAGPRTSHVALVREPIDAAPLTAAVKRGEDGAVVVFDGIVRNNTRGRRTLYLVYEGYEAMAVAQMRKLAEDALGRFAVQGVTIVHRLGRLGVGETSVFIAVASAHRAQAFDACRWLIDTLKKTVPIWKREHFEDGAVWADGEPFPESIVAPALAEGAIS
jgi:molybdopterin converting factor subunit 1